MQCTFCSTVVPDRALDETLVRDPSNSWRYTDEQGHMLRVAYYVNALYKIQDETTYEGNRSSEHNESFPYIILTHDAEHCPKGTKTEEFVLVTSRRSSSSGTLEFETVNWSEGRSNQSVSDRSVDSSPKIEKKTPSPVQFMQKKLEKLEVGNMSVWVSVALVVGVLFILTMVACFGPQAQMGSGVGGTNPLVSLSSSTCNVESMSALAHLSSGPSSIGGANALVNVSSVPGMNALLGISSTALTLSVLGFSSRYIWDSKFKNLGHSQRPY